MTVESSILFVALGKQNRANNLEKKKRQVNWKVDNKK